jgi:hypothetical protein
MVHVQNIVFGGLAKSQCLGKRLPSCITVRLPMARANISQKLGPIAPPYQFHPFRHPASLVISATSSVANACDDQGTSSTSFLGTIGCSA